MTRNWGGEQVEEEWGLQIGAGGKGGEGRERHQNDLFSNRGRFYTSASLFISFEIF
jgi:hypothetical protein